MKKFIIQWEAHPHWDQAWYEDQKTRMTTDEMAREIDRNYSMSVTGRVFEQFTERLHIYRGKRRFNPHRPIYRLWDFGKVNAVLYGQITEYDGRLIEHERILGTSEEGSSTPRQIEAVSHDSQELFPGCTFIDICDPAGSYDDGRGLSTHVDLLNAAGIFPQFEAIKSIPTVNRSERGLTAIKTDLERLYKGDAALMIHESCKTTIEAFQSGYVYKRDRHDNILDVIDERHPYEDVIDVIKYWYLETKATNVKINKQDLAGFLNIGPVDPYTGVPL